MNRILRDCPYVIRTYGLKGMAQRAFFELFKRSGYLKRKSPMESWEEFPLYEGAVREDFFPTSSSSKQLSVFYQENGLDERIVIESAEAILKGELPFFGVWRGGLGFPPDWFLDPVTQNRWDRECHWSEYSTLGNQGDIKLIWEPSRFSFVFVLGRAFLLTGDSRYAEAFWESVESWLEENPPYRGPNWLCGQEVALRSLAWVWGLSVFRESSATTPERRKRLATVLLINGQRIDLTRGYALSQRNNHAISEAVGLLTIGLCLPDAPDAPKWVCQPLRTLKNLVLEQFGEDGSYAQHSFNYQRLALDLCLWAESLLARDGLTLGKEVMSRLVASGRFLFQFQSEDSGFLPNYGSNDGAWLLQLSQSAYRDYRPTVQAIYRRFVRENAYGAGPWDELGWWLGLDPCDGKNETNPTRASFRAETGGYYTLREGNSFAFIRGANYRNRPAQADNLHVDIWVRGRNVAFDPGTYFYNGTSLWQNALTASRVHNIATLEEKDQMKRKGKFFWTDWVSSRVVDSRSETGWEYLELEHQAYRYCRSVFQQRRAVLRLAESFIVIDSVNCDRERPLFIGWNLAYKPISRGSRRDQFYLEIEGIPKSYPLQFWSSTETKPEVERAKEGDIKGWFSESYGIQTPLWRWESSVKTNSWVHVSAFGMDEFQVQDDVITGFVGGDPFCVELETRSRQKQLAARVTFRKD